jgi:hypothetical protein
MMPMIGPDSVCVGSVNPGAATTSVILSNNCRVYKNFFSLANSGLSVFALNSF